MNTKCCSRCGQDLPLTAFHLDHDGAFGRHSKCKACRAMYFQDRYGKKSVGRDFRPAYYADSRQGRTQKKWQDMLNQVPALTRGNLSPVVRSCWEVAA